MAEAPGRDGKQYLRMQDVRAATGMSRSTLHMYIREGVLPRPKKTSVNQALYDEDFVQRAKLVQALKANTHLPLASIKEALKKIPKGAAGQVDDKQFVKAAQVLSDSLRLPTEGDVSTEELIATSNVHAKDLEELASNGLITLHSGDQDLISPLDARIALALARMKDAYIRLHPELDRDRFEPQLSSATPSLLAAYRKHLTELARVHVQVMTDLVRTMPLEQVDTLFKQTADSRDELVAAIYRKLLAEALQKESTRPGKNRSAPPDDECNTARPKRVVKKQESKTADPQKPGRRPAGGTSDAPVRGRSRPR